MRLRGCWAGQLGVLPIRQQLDWDISVGRIRNIRFRELWLESRLAEIPAGQSLLDVGAGECANKGYCAHLDYVSQDIAQYDGKGDGSGLQTGKWDFRQIDIVCDLYDTPEDRQFDNVLCTEVLEHVVDPVRALEKLARLVKPGGQLIITAPFTSMTHFSPYHYCTGFSRFSYQTHLPRLNIEIEELSSNGGFFDMLDQELGRARKVRKQYSGWPMDPLSFLLLFLARMNVRLLAALDGARADRRSADLQTFGWHVRARRKH
jgi:SAM-dependent methyltransferase